MEASKISTEFIGNDAEYSKLVSWLDGYFHSKQTGSNYAIVVGDSGNGKTTLVRSLAHDYQVPILEITPYDIQCKEDINTFKKKLNCGSVYSTSSNKIILIDDIDMYNKTTQRQLMFAVPKLSVNPIIFTSKIYHLLPSFKKDRLVCSIKKLLPKELKTLLQQKLEEFNLEISDELLDKIIVESVSNRSAINSLFSSTIAEVIDINPSLTTKFNQAKTGSLLYDIEPYDLKQFSLNTLDPATLEYLADLEFKSQIFFPKQTKKELLNNKKLTFNDEFQYLHHYNNIILNDHEKIICKKLHISSRLFYDSYRALFFHEEPKKEKGTVSRVKKHVAPATQDLSSFY